MPDDNNGLVDEKFEAWKKVAAAIEKLDPDSQETVIRIVCLMFDIKM